MNIYNLSLLNECFVYCSIEIFIEVSGVPITEKVIKRKTDKNI